MAIQASHQSLSFLTLWSKQPTNPWFCRLPEGGPLFLAQIPASLTSCLVETPLGPHRTVPCHPCYIFSRQLGSSLSGDAWMLWHSQPQLAQSQLCWPFNVPEDVRASKAAWCGSNNLSQRGLLSTAVSLPGSMTLANSPARARGPTVGTRWEKVNVRGPQESCQETEEFLCAYCLATQKRSWIWATGGECHCRQWVSYEIKIAENFHSSGKLESQRCLWGWI